MEIICFETDDLQSAAFKALDSKLGIKCLSESLSEENAHSYDTAEIISCSVRSNLHATALDKLKNLKLICTRSTGTDHIDLAYCQKRGILVSNVPTYGEHTIAEHVFALLLGLSHNLSEATRNTRNGNFAITWSSGFDLHGKTLGLIGTGSIGTRVAEIANGFGMKVIGYDILPSHKPPFKSVSLEELLSNSDIISLHVPSTPKTEDMISDDQFLLMKNGVVIINTARGSIINVEALLQALDSGKVRAAGLDVLPYEYLINDKPAPKPPTSLHLDPEAIIADYRLMHHENVIVTPHSAFYTKEAVQRILETTISNMVSFIAGKPSNLVDAKSLIE